MLGAAGVTGSHQLEGLGAVLGNLLLRVRCDIANRVAEVVRGERGATAVEYGLLIVFIAAVVLVMVRHLGLDTRAGFRRAGIGW
ncbi:MAG TPA: Flp family type IVb pilin [Actinomycetota bacterium]|jgi:Flp pilus assembly pilin Flp|nr:Flp family type IVb pilin [Actinomycetota bacterium]